MKKKDSALQVRLVKIPDEILKNLKKITPSDVLSTHCAASASTTTAVSQNIHIHKLISVLILFSYVYGKKIRIK